APGILRLQIGQQLVTLGERGERAEQGRHDDREARHWQFYIVERREAAAKGLSREENKLPEVRQEKSVARLCAARHEDRAAVGDKLEAENREIGEVGDLLCRPPDPSLGQTLTIMALRP